MLPYSEFSDLVERAQFFHKLQLRSIEWYKQSRLKTRSHATPIDYMAWCGVGWKPAPHSHYKLMKILAMDSRPHYQPFDPLYRPVPCHFCGQLGGTLAKVAPNIYVHKDNSTCADRNGRGGL
jgi:hypothetical protein